MRKNLTRERLNNGETVLGCSLQVYRSPEVARTFAAAGFDYVFIDMEHGSFNLETVHDIIVASKLSGITPIVRVVELQYGLCSRLLDQGAQGIILPRVEDPAILEDALSWLRYPPIGKRGYGINATMIEYESAGLPAVVEHQNSQVLAVVQFESAAAIERADELLSVPGLDVVMVGPADLSISLGVAGDWEHPLLIDAIQHIIEKCNRWGVVPGIQTRGLSMAKAWAGRGMRFIGVGAEHVLLLEKARETVSQLRSALNNSVDVEGK